MASYQFNPINILDTTNAIGVGSGGSLNVGGGVSINKDLYIGGNILVSGTTASFSDNIIVLNSNNTISNIDMGVLFQRSSSNVTFDVTNGLGSNNNYSGIIYDESARTFDFGYLSADSSFF